MFSCIWQLAHHYELDENSFHEVFFNNASLCETVATLYSPLVLCTLLKWWVCIYAFSMIPWRASRTRTCLLFFDLFVLFCYFCITRAWHYTWLILSAYIWRVKPYYKFYSTDKGVLKCLYCNFSNCYRDTWLMCLAKEIMYVCIWNGGSFGTKEAILDFGGIFIRSWI